MGIIHLQSFSTVQKQCSWYWIKFKPNEKGNKKKISNKEGEKKKLIKKVILMNSTILYTLKTGFSRLWYRLLLICKFMQACTL